MKHKLRRLLANVHVKGLITKRKNVFVIVGLVCLLLVILISDATLPSIQKIISNQTSQTQTIPATIKPLPPFFVSLDNQEGDQVSIRNNQLRISGETHPLTPLIAISTVDSVFSRSSTQGKFVISLKVNGDGDLVTVTGFSEDGEEITTELEILPDDQTTEGEADTKALTPQSALAQIDSELELLPSNPSPSLTATISPILTPVATPTITSAPTLTPIPVSILNDPPSTRIADRPVRPTRPPKIEPTRTNRTRQERSKNQLRLNTADLNPGDAINPAQLATDDDRARINRANNLGKLYRIKTLRKNIEPLTKKGPRPIMGVVESVVDKTLTLSHPNKHQDLSLVDLSNVTSILQVRKVLTPNDLLPGMKVIAIGQDESSVFNALKIFVIPVNSL